MCIRDRREIEALRQRLMKPLLTLRKKIRVCSGRELVEALYEYWKEARILEQLKKQDAQEDAAGRDSVRALFDGMMDLWDQYAMVLGAVSYTHLGLQSGAGLSHCLWRPGL